MTRRLALALLTLLPLSGCAKTHTMRELGFPVFTAVVGDAARYERLTVPQGIDGRPEKGDVGSTHLAHFWPVPAGDADTVFLAIGVEPSATTTPLGRLAVAAYPLHRDALQAFNREGQLPEGSRSLAFAQAGADDDGALRLLLRVPRDQLPPSAEHLALPILVVYADGWIQLRFFRAVIPEPYELDEAPADAEAVGASPPSDGGG
jgi:hypothetical protein